MTMTFALIRLFAEWLKRRTPTGIKVSCGEDLIWWWRAPQTGVNPGPYVGLQLRLHNNKWSVMNNQDHERSTLHFTVTVEGLKLDWRSFPYSKESSREMFEHLCLIKDFSITLTIENSSFFFFTHKMCFNHLWTTAIKCNDKNQLISKRLMLKSKIL